MQKAMEVNNGSCYTRTGKRSVVISPEGEIRQVIRAIYSGYESERCTVQLAEKNDYIFSEEWNSRDTFESVHVVMEDGSLKKLSDIDAAHMWRLCPKVLQEWLEQGKEKRQSSFLPIGYGWTGETEHSRVKRERVETFFSKIKSGIISEDLMERIKTQIVHSPGKNIPTNWKHAELFPEKIELKNYHDLILWYKDGEVEYLSNLDSNEEVEIKVSQDLSKGVLITWNAYKSNTDDSRYGIKWQLFLKDLRK